MSFFSYLGVFLAFISKSSTIINLKIVGGISNYNRVYTITIDFTRFTLLNKIAFLYMDKIIDIYLDKKILL